ncbi:hypothetical protein ACLOJK_041133 [Asimina triloba]
MASKWISSISYKFISFPRSRLESKARAGATLRLPSLGNVSGRDRDRDHQQQHHHVREFRAAFHYLDRNGDGKISSEELRAFFASMGEDMSEAAADGVIADHDRDGDRLLDFEEFMQLVEKDGGNEEDLRRAFEMFEVDKGSGCITPNGLQRMLDRLGDQRTYGECVAMIREFDLDGNGVLDFNEFHAMMA